MWNLAVRWSWKATLMGLVAMLLLAGAAWGQQAPATSAEHDSKTGPVVRSFGTEGGFRTEVRSETKGDFTQDDRRQVSLLAAQVFQHVNAARKALETDDSKQARQEVDKGREAVKAIHALLPKTHVCTKTTGPGGAVLYEDEREIQDDRVPLFEGMLHARTLAPIREAQRDASRIAGVQVVEAETVSTEVTTDLSYVEGQLGRAAKALDEKKAEEAIRALSLAQTRGVEFQYKKEDSTLAEARDAIWLAKRALEENNSVQAQANLAIAHQRLELYRQVVPDLKRQDVTDLMKEMRQLEKQLQQEDQQLASQADRSRQGGTVTQWWDRLNGWIKRRF